MIERIAPDLIENIDSELMTLCLTDTSLAADDSLGRQDRLLSDVGSLKTWTNFPRPVSKDHAGKMIPKRFPI